MRTRGRGIEILTAGKMYQCTIDKAARAYIQSQNPGGDHRTDFHLSPLLSFPRYPPRHSRRLQTFKGPRNSPLRPLPYHSPQSSYQTFAISPEISPSFVTSIHKIRNQRRSYVSFQYIIPEKVVRYLEIPLPSHQTRTCNETSPRPVKNQRSRKIV